jgi:glycosyltransferase involved in cell wall biosynthesis
MKIGIDARLLSRPLTGIGRYTLEICRALSKQLNTSLYLYSPAPIRKEFLFGLETANIQTKNWHHGFLRQLWSESFLPLWAKDDDVDVFWGPGHRLPRLLSKKIARVVTVHDLVWKYVPETMRPLSRLLERYQMPLAVYSSDAVVADSIATAEAVKKEYSLEGDRLSVVPLSANLTERLDYSEILHQLAIVPSYFLFVGTLEPRKNLVRLLTAYSQLENGLKEQTKLVIAGGKGWGGVDITQVITELGLTKFVRILGYVDDATLSALYSNAEFLAMPSLYEGFGLPLLESMVHGTPVLTSNNSSMPEVAGDAGVLVDALDVGSIMEGLDLLIGNKQYRCELANNAKGNAARYSWDKSAEQLFSVFEKAILARKTI